MIEENVKKLLSEIPEKNIYGEKVTLVAAVKLQNATDINRAVNAGITDIGDNHVQEFKEKYGFITGNPRRHFIGHLQTNKVKYLIGKVDLYHSLDRLALAEELSKRSLSAEVVSSALLQVNIGDEQSKGGFAFDEALDAYKKATAMPSLKLKGLMAMLPFTDDLQLLKRLAAKMRELFERVRDLDGGAEYLSMGMSGDYKLCVDAGSNVIRLGTAIFGQRNYN
ncbi:MAG: YggS family pyridoxal phosphate-dependent enzyme [Clostridia bacterium]|nr:YggS family pyridoxal phosphate-dependent enzyme [Clostridia bacterium]